MKEDFIPLQYLMNLRKPGDVSNFLQSLDNSFSWENFGKDETNYPRLAFSKSGVTAMIERITNAIDAILENKKETRKNSTDNEVSSPREAIEKWFNVKGGHISFLNEKERREIAQNSISLILEDSGIEKKPTVVVKDIGIGIHPEDFEGSIVGLGGSLKRTKSYLLGAYGWGGSQTLIWCNGALDATNVESLPLAIIVSRKNPLLLTDGQKDEVGWTIIRYKDNPHEKHGVFQYLIKNGKIPTAAPKNLPKDFPHGTCITHIAYHLESFYGRMTLASYRLFQGLLFDPVLPFWLYDARYKEGRTISGNLSRLSTDEKGFIEYQNTQTQTLNFGNIKIRYWVLKSRKDGFHIDSYLTKSGSQDSIFITLNGQQYSSLRKQIIKDAGFSFLSDYLIFQIECDFLSPQMKKNIFPSTREDIREQYKEVFKNEVISILQNDEELKKLEESRKKEHLTSGDEESIKRVRRLLDKFISINKKIIKGGLGSSSKKKKPEFKSKDPPTFIEISFGNKEIEFIPGEEKKIIIKTDAPNDFLVRDNSPGNLELGIDNPQIKFKIRQGILRDGKINSYIEIVPTVPISTKGRLICTLKASYMKDLTDNKNVKIVSSPPPLPSNYPPQVFEIANEEIPLKIKKGRRSLIQIKCDGPDGLIERPVDNALLHTTFLPDLGIKIIGNSDLIKHKIRIFLQCPDNIEIGKRAEVQCKLELSNNTTLRSTRQCIIITPPPESGGKDGQQDIEVPNYQIIQVQPEDKNWNEFMWDENDVGKYMKSGEELILYVSMGNQHYLNTIDSSEIISDKLKTFKEKYTSYIGYHLWLLFDDKFNEDNAKTELKRLCQTVLLALSQDP